MDLPWPGYAAHVVEHFVALGRTPGQKTCSMHRTGGSREGSHNVVDLTDGVSTHTHIYIYIYMYFNPFEGTLRIEKWP